MNESLIQNIIQSGLDYKADFVEVYVEESRASSLSFKDNKVETATAGTDYGIGIRLVYGSEVLYGFTSSEEEKDLLELTQALAKTRKIKKGSSNPITISRSHINDIHKIIQRPASVKSSMKVDILGKANDAARKHSSLVKQVSASITDSDKKILIANSEGLLIEDQRVRTRFTIGVTAEENGELFTASETPGALKGFEFIEGINIEDYAVSASKRALLMLTAGYITGGKMPVIMGNAFGGVIFHEACGHPLETEAIRKKASPFTDKLN